MLDDEFNTQRANLIRDLASRADPFIKRRLLDLAARYEKHRTKPLPVPPINGRQPAVRNGGGDANG